MILQRKITYGALLLLITVAACKQPEHIPYLRQQGTAVQLMVNDQPFIILGGELGNSTSSSFIDTEDAFAKLQKLNLNTVLVPAYWEQIETEEGKFNFSLIDDIINSAQKHNLKIVFLWFGAWKNSMSCYAPAWIKENWAAYPRAVTEAGKTLEILTAFDENNLRADRRAFCQFMSHLASMDKNRTVIMIQVENEIGMLESARDYCEKANRLFQAEVPPELVDYLMKNKQNLQHSLLEKWEAAGCKTTGTWTTLFGDGLETEELFMAWHYGVFMQELIKAGKEIYDLPMYVNAALNSRGRRPGQYPSAGPLAHLLDIWRAAAPDLDFIAPDIYDPVFTDWCRQYHTNNNPLFIPEIRLEDANAASVFYALGEHDAMGFSPFSIENGKNTEEYPLSKSYKLLKQLLPLLSESQGQNRTNGVLLNKDNRERRIEKNGYTFTFRHVYTLGWDAPANDGSNWNEAGALMIELSADEYIIAGTGIVLTFGNTKDDKTITGISFIDEVKFDGGKMIPVQRLNGDQNHQGRHLRIPAGTWSIQHVKLYDYK
jgi:beta-galactosidase GanA